MDVDERRAKAELRRQLRTARRAARRERADEGRAHRLRRRAELNAALASTAARLRPVAPISLVTALAMYGQLAYALEQIVPPGWLWPARLGLAVGIAVAVESISLYVQWHAHDALLHGHTLTAARLRRVSYLLAGGIAVLNYSHFSDGWAPNPAAVCFALFSAVGPWLWGLHTRRAQRVQLSREGQLDSTGATFSAERYRWFPWRTLMALRWSIDHGVTDPRAAWEGYNAERVGRRDRRLELRERRRRDRRTGDKAPPADSVESAGEEPRHAVGPRPAPAESIASPARRAHTAALAVGAVVSAAAPSEPEPGLVVDRGERGELAVREPHARAVQGREDRDVVAAPAAFAAPAPTGPVAAASDPGATASPRLASPRPAGGPRAGEIGSSGRRPASARPDAASQAAADTEAARLAPHGGGALPRAERPGQGDASALPTRSAGPRPPADDVECSPWRSITEERGLDPRLLQLALDADAESRRQRRRPAGRDKLATAIRGAGQPIGSAALDEYRDAIDHGRRQQQAGQTAGRDAETMTSSTGSARAAAAVGEQVAPAAPSPDPAADPERSGRPELGERAAADQPRDVVVLA